MKTITLRLDDTDAQVLENVKKLTGEKTASKAIKQCLKLYCMQARTIANLEIALDQSKDRTYMKLWED
jgi:hypothetical protein